MDENQIPLSCFIPELLMDQPSPPRRDAPHGFVLTLHLGFLSRVSSASRAESSAGVEAKESNWSCQHQLLSSQGFLVTLQHALRL